MNNTILTKQVTRVLAESGIQITARMEAQLATYLELVHEWNAFAGLVAPGDLGVLVTEHLTDAISLAPWVVALWRGKGPLLDIGSGGGFPALPVKVVVPELPLVLVERSGKKVGFLWKVVGALGLEGIDIRHGAFPEITVDVQPEIITARAVENPAKLSTAILGLVAEGAVYLCQSSTNAIPGREMFHVERVDDVWTTLGLRRASLHLVRHR
ncbi:MAG TPA: class I SAM-dependent methyltransferase [Candidatus Hydrogenedentes bacterium]|nr:class I SAM-dependent methyltransferase [Candidatus Hydrogenedentota bacterium]